MEAILLGIYAFFVWLIFIKFKWLPWNTTSQVTVVIIPIVALAVMILTLNVVAPSSSDVRVLKYVVQIVPQVRGRVIEVPVEPNRLVKKGELDDIESRRILSPELKQVHAEFSALLAAATQPESRGS